MILMGHNRFSWKSYIEKWGIRLMIHELVFKHFVMIPRVLPSTFLPTKPEKRSRPLLNIWKTQNLSHPWEPITGFCYLRNNLWWCNFVSMSAYVLHQEPEILAMVNLKGKVHLKGKGCPNQQCNTLMEMAFGDHCIPLLMPS